MTMCLVDGQAGSYSVWPWAARVQTMVGSKASLHSTNDQYVVSQAQRTVFKRNHASVLILTYYEVKTGKSVLQIRACSVRQCQVLR